MIALVLMTVWGRLGFDTIIYASVPPRAAAFLTDGIGLTSPCSIQVTGHAHGESRSSPDSFDERHGVAV